MWVAGGRRGHNITGEGGGLRCGGVGIRGQDITGDGQVDMRNKIHICRGEGGVGAMKGAASSYEGSNQG